MGAPLFMVKIQSGYSASGLSTGSEPALKIFTPVTTYVTSGEARRKSDATRSHELATWKLTFPFGTVRTSTLGPASFFFFSSGNIAQHGSASHM